MKKTNKLTPNFNPQMCTIVNITGPEVTVITRKGEYVSRNKSFFKRFSIVTSDDDEEEELQSSSLRHNNVIVADSEDPAVRRSTRVSRAPERYGNVVPSNVINIIEQEQTKKKVI